MPENKLLDEQWVNVLAQTYGGAITEPIKAELGDPVSGLVGVPLNTTDVPGQVFVHAVAGDPLGTGTAINQGLAEKDLVYGCPVLLRKEGSNYIIIGRDGLRANEYFKGVPRSDQREVALSQFNWGLLQPVAPTASMRAFASGALYSQNNTLYRVKDTYTADFSASPLDTSSVAIVVPTTNTRAIAVLVQVDATTGTLSYKQGAEFDAELTHDQAFDAGFYPQRDTNRFAIGYVRLVAGMTAIQKVHIYAAQELISSGAGDHALTISTATSISSGRGQVWAGPIVISSILTVNGRIAVV